MKLLVMLIVLVLFYFRVAPRFFAIDIIGKYLKFCNSLFDKKNWYQHLNGLLLVVLSFSFVLGAIDSFLDQDNALIIIRFVLEVLLVICALMQLGKLKFFSITPKITPDALNQAQLQQLSATTWQEAYTLIAPIFWYTFLGIYGLALYWAVAYLHNTSKPSWQAHAALLLEILVWAPARILAFAYAVVGHFSQTIQIWNEYLATGIAYNQHILKRCMYAAISSSDTEARVQRDAKILLLGIYSILIVLSWFI